MREVKRKKKALNKLEKQISTAACYFQSEKEWLFCLNSPHHLCLPPSDTEQREDAAVAGRWGGVPQSQADRSRVQVWLCWGLGDSCPSPNPFWSPYSSSQKWGWCNQSHWPHSLTGEARQGLELKWVINHLWGEWKLCVWVWMQTHMHTHSGAHVWLYGCTSIWVCMCVP